MTKLTYGVLASYPCVYAISQRIGTRVSRRILEWLLEFTRVTKIFWKTRRPIYLDHSLCNMKGCTNRAPVTDQQNCSYRLTIQTKFAVCYSGQKVFFSTINWTSLPHRIQRPSGLHFAQNSIMPRASLASQTVCWGKELSGGRKNLMSTQQETLPTFRQNHILYPSLLFSARSSTGVTPPS